MFILTGTHGSTFGGNPLGSRVAMAGLQVLEDENLSQNSFVMGKLMRERLRDMKGSVITEVRGKGLMNAIDINTGK